MNFSNTKMIADDRESECLGEHREDPTAAARIPVGESRSSLDPRASDTTRRMVCISNAE